MDVHVDVHPGRGPHLLLVHGFLSSRGQWTPNLKALAEVCTPVTLELLGHGRSASPDDPRDYTVAAYVDAFEALRRKLGAERWLVCGQSFGAGLTIRYALEHAARVAGQVFTNSMSGLSPPYPDDPLTRDARAEALRKGGRAALEAMPLYPKPSKRLPPEVWGDLVEDAVLLSPHGVAETIRTTVPGVSVAADLARIAVPSLLVNGRREAAFQPLRDLAASRIAGLEIVDLDGGHAVNLDCPDAFNAAVAAFVAAHWE
jgi:2-succinyl-6-hydroxy-2,4-cyclohexadiene-1-carboxylate synthase